MAKTARTASAVAAVLVSRNIRLVAAAMAANRGIHPRDLDVKSLKKALLEANVFLG